jgi:predicted RNA-binding Zn ribbon-like protein
MLPSWVPEIETKPAPGDLLLLQAFVNTYEADTSIDMLADLSAGNAWLHESGLVPAGIDLDEEALSRARPVREALRSLLDYNAGQGQPEAAGVQLLNDAAGKATLRLAVVAEDGYRVKVEPADADPLGTAVVRLILIVRDAQLAGTWDRLKACSNLECRWAYYDRSHSHKGRWCDMATCGNRVKNRALRARHAEKASPTPRILSTETE